MVAQDNIWYLPRLSVALETKMETGGKKTKEIAAV